MSLRNRYLQVTDGLTASVGRISAFSVALASGAAKATPVEPGAAARGAAQHVLGR